MTRVFPFAAALALALPAAALAHDGAHDSYTVNGEEFDFSTDEMVVEAGSSVTITFKNGGSISHNLAVPELGVTTETIQGGETAELTFTPEEPGTYSFVCSVPGHEEAGMNGKLIVQ